MFHRLSSWWRALGVVLFSLASLVWPSNAGAASGTFSVVHQDAATTLTPRGVARFHLGLSFSAPLKGTLEVALYPLAVTRSGLAPIITGVGDSAAPLATTGAVAVDCAAHSTHVFTVNLLTATARAVPEPCGARSLNLHLTCRSASCEGVYPLRYSVQSGATTTTEWSLVAVRVSRVVRPISLDWISSLGPSSWRHAGRATRDFNAIAAQQLPVSLGVDYRTLASALISTTATGAAWRQAFSRALTNPLHRVVAAPPSSIDFGGLAANGLTTQVALQLTLTSNLLTELNGRFVDPPLVVSGNPSLASLSALSSIGVRDVVMPESALSVAPSSTLAWGSPFHVAGTPQLVLATDQPLSALAMDASIEPGRRAAMTLATLAFLHFEAPNAPATRIVVVNAPVAYTSPTYLDQLFAGLAHNPFVHATSLTPSFDSSLVGTNSTPTTRTMAHGSDPAWSARNVDTLRTLIGAVTSYANAIASKSVSQGLRVAVASAEIVGSPSARQALITRASDRLGLELNQFSIESSSITLAGTGTALPITLLSRAPYPVTVAVHLEAGGITFPAGRNVTTTLSAPATSLRVPIGAGHENNATLQVTLTTPNGQVELARAAISVRIAGASLVGYLLTLASLMVLAMWWWRTLRRGRKGRHAR
ncbi:MAG TPA: hypothetical protein VLS91_04620 [Acidimicrobiales bacterium]|nr:hypothetical protein [Acidimicrobiales bacterium]